MPYRISGLCVEVEKDGKWETVKCHPDSDKAKAHLAALNGNVMHDKSMLRLTQKEVDYTALSAKDGQACANCRWFVQHEQMPKCHIIENYPDMILPTGWCNRHELRTFPEMEAEPEMAHEMGERGFAEKWFQAFKAFFQRSQPETYSSFKAYGDYWHGTWTNNVEDREGEWIAAKAIHDYIRRVDSGLTPLPYLCVWHGGEKARIGQAKHLSTIEHNGIVIVSAIGTWDETPEAQRAKEFYNRTSDPQGMSHGFIYPRTAYKKRVYYAINPFELTVLPMKRAANAYTGFPV